MGPISVERQLQVLAECDVRLSPGITLDDIRVHGERSDFEATPFEPLPCATGSKCGPSISRRASDDVWAFDVECIEGDGSYAEVARRVAALAPEALPLERVDGSVDHDAGRAWPALQVGETPYR